MKKLFLASLIFIFAISASAENINASSSISKVTVYRQGAKIEHNTKVAVPSGSHLIYLTNVSTKLNPQSIQVKIPGGIILQSAVYREDYITPRQVTKEIQLYKDSIDVMEFDLQLLNDKIEALKQEESLILANKNIGGQNVGVDAQNLITLAKYYNERLPVIKNNITTHNRKQKKMQEKLKKYKDQLAVVSGGLNKPVGQIILQVNNPASKTVNIQFSYIITDAGWFPSYDIRSDDINTPITLTYKANVFQNSNIDWENAKLNISTGNPIISASRPILRPWFIDFGHQVSRSVEVYQRNMALENAKPAPAQADDGAWLGNHVQVTDDQLNMEFEIDLEYTIPADGKTHLVSIKDHELPVKYQYHAVPKLDKDAFLLAKVTGWEKLNLLPGLANIFFQDTYIGQSQIDPRHTSDTLLLSMGRDQNIIVKREQIRDFTKTKFIGMNKRETVVYEITVRNNKSIPVDIEILENIPLSKNSEIEVTVENVSGADYDKESGRLKWSTSLAPQESKKYRVEYTVKYPKDKIIPGL